MCFRRCQLLLNVPHFFFFLAIFKASSPSPTSIPPLRELLSSYHAGAESILERREEIASATANDDTQYDNLSRCGGEWATDRDNNQHRPSGLLLALLFLALLLLDLLLLALLLLPLLLRRLI